jgi:hypothetical protein
MGGGGLFTDFDVVGHICLTRELSPLWERRLFVVSSSDAAGGSNISCVSSVCAVFVERKIIEHRNGVVKRKEVNANAVN